MRKKKSAIRISGVAVGAMASLAALSVPASAHSGHDHSGAPVFVQTDRLSGNTVVAYTRAADGSLTQRGEYTTGGLGGQLEGTSADHLASQGSLTYDSAHRLLYAVNAGSSTVTVFKVDGNRLVRRQVISSGGKFPVSVTAHDNQVFVLNAEGGGSVQGYLNVAGHLVRVPAWHRDLGLSTTSSPAQVSFSPDGRDLVVATKGAGNSFVVFPVRAFGVSARPTVTATPGQAPFGFTFDARGRIVTTDSATNSVVTFAFGRGGKLTKVSQVATDQRGTCWIVGTGRNFYAANAGSGTITRVQADHHGTLHTVGNIPAAAGAVDEAVSEDGKHLYVQIGATGEVESFRINHDGSLSRTGSVTVPDAIGGEGIVAL